MMDDSSHAGAQQFVEIYTASLKDQNRKIGLVVGFGEGHEADYLRKHLNAFVVGIDVHSRLPQGATPLFEPTISDALKLPFSENQFDFVFYHHVIEHVPDPLKSLEEILRVLRPGGILYIGTPNRHRVIGYLGAYKISLKRKIRNNLNDWKARLTGRFRNELGAHAGFSERELHNLLCNRFTRIQWVTRPYIHRKYARRLPKIFLNLFTWRPVMEVAANAIYVVCHKPLAREEPERITMNMLGTDINCLAYEEMYPIFDRWLEDKTAPAHSLALANVATLVLTLLEPKAKIAFKNADLIGIDGMPFLYWARLFYYRPSERFYAPDLMLEVSRKAKEKGYSFFLFGGYPEAPEKMKEFLEDKFPGIKIVGTYSPPFKPLTPAEDQAICDMINQHQPDFLWIGLGSPKQDLWIEEHREKIRGCIMVPSGATFDFFSGRIRQAPKWVQTSGFEWLFRLTQDFRRLWIRYTVYNIIFITLFFLQIVGIIKFDKTK